MGFRAVNVTACAIFPCIKTYNISVTDGLLNTQELSSWSDPDGYQLGNCVPGGLCLSPPSSAVLVNRRSESELESNVFVVDEITAEGLKSLLQGAFSGTASAGNSGLRDGYGITYSSEIMQALHLADDLGALMASFAASMSDHIRNVSAVTETGTAWAMESYIQVRWRWLILPMSLGPASLCSLCAVICISRRREVQVWKSSTLATLFHGLDNLENGPDLNRQSDMESFSKQIIVRLHPRDETSVGRPVLKETPPDRLALKNLASNRPGGLAVVDNVSSASADKLLPSRQLPEADHFAVRIHPTRTW
ncbi:hypothetical protein A1O1_04063 [Capronia coronata CBS 617.96]|uniref:Uncharacterized protein n=1 Tax=Capronia coronata CBS 617.96 TaxID=1182541 RepID=W9YP05_9EURO|nr:uncharacterized protein A1O1_04063 [Capronia coronata CBS 617.96]EXJ90956.1 hypothetical protein A1O1_04063 [Capronia coronata CBS 617.96]